MEPQTEDAVETDALAGGLEVLDILAAEWRQLCEHACDDHPFCRPEWIAAYARQYEAGQKFLLASARRSGRLIGLLPLVRERGRLCGLPVRILRGAGNGAPRFDIVRTAPEHESADAVAALWRLLRQDPAWDVIQFAVVPENAAIRQLMAAAEGDGFRTGIRPAFRTPYIRLTDFEKGGEDPWLARTSYNFRGLVRKKSRRLAEQGPLCLERFDTAAPEALRRYEELEQSTWKGKRGCAIGMDDPNGRFHAEIARRAGEFGYLSLYLLRSGDRTVAGQFGLTYRRKYLFLRCAFNQEFNKFSPAHILINLVLRDCAARGLSEFDFLGEDHDWKRPWTSDTREHAFCYIFRPGVYGQVLHALKFRVTPLGRRLLRRAPAGVRSEGEE